MTALLTIVPLAKADITIDADKVVREVPPTFNGTNIQAHTPNFATNADGINFQADLKAAKVQVVRTLAYPDYRKPDHAPEYFDNNVSAILASGAKPVFLQYINPGQAYFREDGAIGTTDKPGSPESNLVDRVRHFMAAPFNLDKQIWEVGNEPDIKVDLKISVEDYCAQFNRVHEALIKAGLRDHVTLCGPVTSGMYWNRADKRPPVTDYLNTFMEKCSAAVDIVDTHTYCTFGIPQNDELLGLTRIDKLDTRFVTDKPSTPTLPYDGMAALLAKMDTIHFGRADVGVAITEYGAMTHHKPLTGALWNLAATQESLYNPRMRMLNSFIFDGAGKEPDTVAHFGADKQRNYIYWALWIAGNLRGNQVLHRDVAANTMPDGRSFLIAGATSDGQHIYVEVINRSPSSISDKVIIRGKSIANDGQVFTMAEGILPDQSKPFPASNTFTYEFPASSATVFCLNP